MTTMRLQQLEADQVDEAHAIILACARDLVERRGLSHWDPPYPLERLRRDALERAVYAVREGSTAVATFTVGMQPPRSYDMAVFAVPAAPALYVNRLAVQPDLQGQGIGEACMALIEGLARERDCTAVRLDASARDARLLAFYGRLGYTRRSTLGGATTPFIYFEKRLTAT